MKKIICAALAAVFLLALPTSALAIEPDTSITAQGIYLQSLDTDQVLYEKNADTQLAPASMTNIMTALLAMELCQDLDNTTITAPAGIYNEFAGLNVSTANILAGETYSVRQLLYCMMLQSANEAASIVATYFGDGNMQKFISMMNDKAKEIGCTNTNFVNPHGLDADNHYSTPSDMALIAKYALQIPGFLDIVSATRYSLPATPKQAARTLVTAVKPQDTVNGGSLYNPYIKGIKTGTTDAAGRCFVSTYSREGENYLCVVMNAPNDTPLNKAFVLTNELYNWVWKNFSMATVVKKGDLIHEDKLLYTFGQNTMLLKAGDDFGLLLPVGADASSIQKTVTLDKSPLEAPLKEGEKVGVITLKLEGKTVGEIPLLTASSAKRSNLLFVLYKIKAIMTSTPAKIIMALLALLVLAYLVLLVISARNHKNKGRIGGRPVKRKNKRRKY